MSSKKISFASPSLYPLIISLTFVGCDDSIKSQRQAVNNSEPTSACGRITYQGCCRGITLYYCANGQPLSQNCGPTKECGWNANYNLYTCGSTSESDPSGQITRECPNSDGGAMDASMAKMDNSTADSDASIHSDLNGCGAINFTGCCSGTTLTYCVGGKILTLDCNQHLHCGWNSTGHFYDCGTSGTPDPSGEHPMECKWPGGDGGFLTDGERDQATEYHPHDFLKMESTVLLQDQGSNGDREISSVDYQIIKDGQQSESSNLYPSSDFSISGLIRRDGIGGSSDNDGSGCSCKIVNDNQNKWSNVIVILLFTVLSLCRWFKY